MRFIAICAVAFAGIFCALGVANIAEWIYTLHITITTSRVITDMRCVTV